MKLPKSLGTKELSIKDWFIIEDIPEPCIDPAFGLSQDDEDLMRPVEGPIRQINSEKPKVSWSSELATIIPEPRWNSGNRAALQNFWNIVTANWDKKEVVKPFKDSKHVWIAKNDQARAYKSLTTAGKLLNRDGTINFCK